MESSEFKEYKVSNDISLNSLTTLTPLINSISFLFFTAESRPAAAVERLPQWDCCNQRLLALADDG